MSELEKLRELEIEEPELFYSLDEYLEPVSNYFFQTGRKFTKDRNIYSFLTRELEIDADIDEVKQATRGLEELGALRPYRNLVNPVWRVRTYTTEDYLAVKDALETVREEDREAREWVEEDIESDIEMIANGQLSIYDFE